MTKTVEEAISDINEVGADEFLKEDAKRLGIPWHEYCYRFGVLGEAQRRRIRRHEAQHDPDWTSGER